MPRLVSSAPRRPAAVGRPVARRSSAPRPATDKQKAFIRTLATERTGHTPTDEQLAKLNVRQASEFIDWLKTQPRKVTPQAAPAPQAEATPAPAPAPKPELVEGVYVKDGETFKVQRSGRGHLYAKRLVELAEPRQLKTGTRTHTFQYEPGAVAGLTPEHLAKAEDLAAIGRVTGSCCRCGMLLTDPKSVEAGIGPVCAKKSR